MHADLWTWLVGLPIADYGGEPPPPGPPPR